MQPPDLTLTPSVAAPGAFIQVKTMANEVTYVSGTSFSSPYTAGLLAMWRQYKAKQAAAQRRALAPREVDQDAALRNLVATARGVADPLTPGFYEPVARMGAGEAPGRCLVVRAGGCPWLDALRTLTCLAPDAPPHTHTHAHIHTRARAGLVQAQSFLLNRVRLEPMMLQLPSALAGPHTTNVTLVWEGGPEDGSEPLTWDLQHTPSVAMTLNDGWYGTSAISREALAANVYFHSDSVTLDPAGKRGARATFTVTFSLPAALRSRPLLYSGLLELTSLAPGAAPSLVVPYQGFAQDMSRLRVPARAQPDVDMILSGSLASLGDALCYAPHSAPRFINAILDAQVAVPGVCSGGFAESANSSLEVSLGVLAASPECSLRVTVVPETSMRRCVGMCVGHVCVGVWVCVWVGGWRGQWRACTLQHTEAGRAAGPERRPPPAAVHGVCVPHAACGPCC
jgi:hypothetical protein